MSDENDDKSSDGSTPPATKKAVVKSKTVAKKAPVKKKVVTRKPAVRKAVVKKEVAEKAVVTKAVTRVEKEPVPPKVEVESATSPKQDDVSSVPESVNPVAETKVVEPDAPIKQAETTSVPQESANDMSQESVGKKDDKAVEVIQSEPEKSTASEPKEPSKPELKENSMSSESQSKPQDGFVAKIIIISILVIAGFMYIRSVANNDVVSEASSSSVEKAPAAAASVEGEVQPSVDTTTASMTADKSAQEAATSSVEEATSGQTIVISQEMVEAVEAAPGSTANVVPTGDVAPAAPAESDEATASIQMVEEASAAVEVQAQVGMGVASQSQVQLGAMVTDRVETVGNMYNYPAPYGMYVYPPVPANNMNIPHPGGYPVMPTPFNPGYGYGYGGQPPFNPYYGQGYNSPYGAYGPYGN